MTIKASVAFFFSHEGDLIQVADSHIARIIRHPERFGLTKEEIQSIYEMHGERIGVGGDLDRNPS